LNPQKIAITGFMCSGKTTVARALGQLLGGNVIDLDEAILRCEGRSAAHIIDHDGLDAFRETETRVLAIELVQGAESVISLGGGTWTVEQNRRLLSEHGYSTVWLDAPFELCWKRIEEDAGARPLAGSYEVAKQLYQDRLHVYELAQFRYAVTGVETSERIARSITALVFRDRENS
jgi:shikimate kinase